MIFLSAILALLLCSELFLQPGRSITFDGKVHITTIAKYAESFRSGDFFPRWFDGIATLGFPLPLIAHQTTSYLGGLISWLSGNSVFAYAAVAFFSAWIANSLVYKILRLYSSPLFVSIGLCLFNFSPYRIANLYTRGALPEFSAAAGMAGVLYGIILFYRGSSASAYWIMGISIAALSLTHPMMLVISLIAIAGYWVWKHIRKFSWKSGFSISLALSIFLGLLIAGYYLFPLKIENKYFNYGSHETNLISSSFFSLEKLLGHEWKYQSSSVGPLGDMLTPGLLEFVILTMYTTVIFVRKQLGSEHGFWTLASWFTLFMISPLSKDLYAFLPIFQELQHPWRWLSLFSLTLPLVAVFLLESFRTTPLWIIILVAVGVLRIPHLFSKSTIVHDEQVYLFTRANLHTANMNPIWTGDVLSYTPNRSPVRVLEGEGEFRNVFRAHGKMSFEIFVKTPMHLNLNAFYFPGWKVRVNGLTIEPEYQDPQHRGVMLMRLPVGSFFVEAEFEETRVRKLGITLSGIGLFTFILVGVMLNRKRSQLAAT